MIFILVKEECSNVVNNLFDHVIHSVLTLCVCALVFISFVYPPSLCAFTHVYNVPAYIFTVTSLSVVELFNYFVI